MHQRGLGMIYFCFTGYHFVQDVRGLTCGCLREGIMRPLRNGKNRSRLSSTRRISMQ